MTGEAHACKPCLADRGACRCPQLTYLCTRCQAPRRIYPGGELHGDCGGGRECAYPDEPSTVTLGWWRAG